MKNSLKSLILGLALALTAMGFAVAMPLAVRSFTQVTQKQADPVVKPDPSPRPVVTPDTSKPAEIILPEMRGNGAKGRPTTEDHSDGRGRGGRGPAGKGRQAKGGHRPGKPEGPQGAGPEAKEGPQGKDSQSQPGTAPNKPQKEPKASSKGSQPADERQGATDPSSNEGPKKTGASKESKTSEETGESGDTDEVRKSEERRGKGPTDDSGEKASNDAAGPEPEGSEREDDAGNKGKGKRKRSAVGRVTASEQGASSGLATAPGQQEAQSA